MSIETQVIDIMAEQALMEPGDISRDDTLADLGIDSMGLVETIFAIEETFDISVPFNANDPQARVAGERFDISTVGSIVKAVEDLVKDQK